MESPNSGTPFDGIDLSSIPDAPKLKGIYDSVAGQKPEQAAKVLTLSNKLGHPPSFVAGNLPQAEQAAETPHPDLFADIEKNHPVATKFLSDPSNMAVAQHDLPNVAQHSQLVDNARREMSFIEAVKIGLQGSVPGLAIRQKLPDPMPESPSLRLGIGRQLGGLVGDFLPMVAGGVVGGQAGAVAGFAGGGAVAGPPGAIGGLIAGEAVGAGAGAFALPAAMRQVLLDHIEKGNLTGIHDFLDRSLNVMRESAKQGFVGALTAGTGGAAKLAGSGPLMTLAAENAAMTTGGAAVEKKAPTAKDFVENALVLGAMHGAGASGDYMMKRWAEGKRVEADQNFYKAMGQTAESSKLMKLMPESHQELIRRLTDGSPVSDVHVPVQAWDSHFQTTGFDPQDAAHRIGVSQSYTEAKLTGGDVKVPLDVYVSKLVGTPHYDKLAGDVKFSPDGMTLNQLNEQDEAQRDDLEKQQAKLQPQIEADIKASAQEKGIYSDLHTQLTESGVLKGSKQYEQKIKDAAVLSARHYAVEAQLRNMEPQALYDQVKNKFEKGLTSGEEYPKLSAHEQKAASESVGEDAGRGPLAESVRQGAERLEGLPASSPGPSPEVREAARIYARSVGLPVREQTGYVPADPARGRRIAEAFATLKHDPADPEVKAAYDALIRETTAQYHVMKKMGLNIESIKAGQPNPYKNSAAMIEDVRSGHMWFFPTTEGFGSDARFNDHPLFADTAETLDDGTKLKANDLFRVVHDFFGHAKEGVTFGAHGEENAWQSHVRMYSALAARAMTTETRGQNSWVNFHPDSEANRTKPGSVYADQKAALMPEWVSTEGLSPERFERGDSLKQMADKIRPSKFEAPTKTPAFKKWFGKSKVVDESKNPKVVYHGTTQSFTEFSKASRGFLTEAPSARKAFFFSGDSRTAWSYTDLGAGRLADQLKARVDSAERKAQRSGLNSDWDKHSELVGQYEKAVEENNKASHELRNNLGSNIMPVFLKMENPLVHDFKGSEYREETYHDLIQKAKINGKDGVIFKNTVDPGGFSNDKTDVFAVFEPEQIKAALGNSGEFDASNPDILKQGAAEALGEFSPSKKIIKFFKSADVTTIPHELAHAWIEDAFQFVKTGTPDEDYLRHWQPAKDWLGVTDEQDKLTKEQHEKFAQGFEKYIMEGKAPSEDLRPIFFRMAQWMTQVYRELKNSIRGGNVKATDLTESARGFMDRLLASDDEIARASADSGYNPGDIHDAEGVTPDQQRRVRTLQERAHELAVETLVREQMKEISAGNRETLAKERERLTAQHFNEVANEPVFRAYALFNPEGTEERISQPEIWKESHAYLNGKLDHENTAKFDTIAEMSGFSDAKEMAQKLLLTERAPAFETALKSKVDESMKAFADLKDSDAIREAATAAVHNDDSLKLLALEQKILGDLTHEKEVKGEISKRNAISAREAAANAKKNAADILAGKPVKEASAFRPYITAERQAAQRATKALAEGDMAAASQAKGEQMMNHALYMEAYKNSKLVAKLSKVVDKYASRGSDLMGMPFGFMQQIDGLLSLTGLTDPKQGDLPTMLKIAQDMKDKNADPSQIANATGLMVGADGKWRKERLPEFVARVNENYFAIQLPDSMTDPVHRQSFPQGMTMADFRDLTDTMKTIGNIGRTFESYLSAFIKGDLKTNAAALRAKIESEIGKPYGNTPQFGELEQSKLQKAVDWIKGTPDGMITSKVNLLTLCEYLDRMDPNGPAKDNIYRPMERAWNDEAEMRATKASELDAIRKKHYSDKELKTFGDTFARWQIATDEGPKNVKLTKESALILLMNRGSESNLDRLTRGFGVTEERIREITDGLSKKDHEFAQDILDYVNKFWPQAKALEMDVNGVEPAKVQALPIDSAHGTYAGGYFPLAYDFKKSADAYKNAVERNALYKQFTTTAAHTEQGAMRARVESLARPVRLDFSGLYNHLDDVIHDITHRRAIIDVSRFLNQPDARAGIMNAIGQDGYRKIGEDLKAVASSQTEFLMPGEKTVRWFRFATTFATLGYRFGIAPRRLTEDTGNAIREVGFLNLSGAVADTVKDPTAIRSFVQQNSVLMRDRAINRESDFVQMAKQWRGKDSAIKRFAFLQDTLADQALSYPVWKSVYDSSLPKYGADRARELADESIVKTFGSGRELDKVGAQRGGELNRMMSMYYSWHSMMFNRAWLQGKIAGLEYNEGNYGKALAIVASTAATTWVIPAAVDSFWGEVLRNSSTEDDDARKKRIAGKFMEAPFAYFPMARNIAATAAPIILGERGRGYHLSPLEDAAENVVGAAAHGGNILGAKLGIVDGKEFDQRFAEDLTRAMSVIVGAPQQLSTWTFNFVDWLNNEGEANWRDMLTRRTKK